MAAFKDNVPSSSASEDNAERGVTMAAFTPIPRPAGVRGNPGPFGLLCFGMTTCMLMFVTTTWSSAGFIPVVMSYAMFFGGAGQLIAGILELIKGNTFAGTAFSSYGCFWMGWFLFNYFAVSKITPSVLAVALTGDTLWCGLWGVLTFLFYIVTLRKNGCLQTIFLTLWITFFLLAGGNYSARCKEAAGYVGFFCGSSAIYAAIAMLCFGMTTCMLMFVTTTWSSAGFIPVVMSYAMFFGGAGQLIAGILELIKGNTFAGTAFSSYGCFWMGWFLFNYFAVSKITPSVLAVALTGDTLWCGLWGVLTFLFYIVTLRKNGCLQTIFLTLWITFFLLAGGNYSARCKEAAGYVGFFCGSSAIYAAIAMLKTTATASAPCVLINYLLSKVLGCASASALDAMASLQICRPRVTNRGFIPVVMSYAMFFGGAGQLIAGILELIKGNTFAGTAFSSYGCFWMGWFLFNYFAVSKITPSVLAVALTGDTLWCGLWGVLTFLFYIVTLRKNGCLQTIFLTLWITFFLLAGGNYSARCKEAAGYVGFFCGSSAIYAAIAMLCFGMTTCMLMFVTTTWSSAGFIPVVMSYAMFFGGAGQLIAGILELIKGNTFAGTAFSSYGCFWMGWFLFNYFAVSKITPSVLAVALTGDTLWCGLWGVLTFLFYIVTLRKNGCLQTIFLTLWITFFLLAGGNYSARCKEAAGYVGFFCGSSAIYAAIAMLKITATASAPCVLINYILSRVEGSASASALDAMASLQTCRPRVTNRHQSVTKHQRPPACLHCTLDVARPAFRTRLLHSAMAAFKDNVPSSSASEDNAERGVTMAAFTPIPRPAGVRGNPGPFGLLCFGMTTCMLMFVTTTWSSAGFIPVVMSYAMFFGGAGQLIAGILELIKGNTFAGTAFSSYGCFWMGWFLFNYFAVSKITPSVLAVALTGDTLWCGLWGVLTFLFYIVTLRKNGCLQTIFLTLWITFFLLAGGNYSARCKEAAGYVGFFCGSSAIYAAIAMLKITATASAPCVLIDYLLSKVEGSASASALDAMASLRTCRPRVTNRHCTLDVARPAFRTRLLHSAMAAFKDNVPSSSASEDNAERGVTMATFTPIPRPAGVRGNPGPFGLLCFGMTTCMLMFVTTTWSSAGFIPVVMSYAMFFGGAGQLIAGILELIKGNTFAGTAFSSYGCFWMGWFLFNYFAVSKITPSVLAVALTGDTLWCGLWGVLTFLFYIVTLRKNGCLQTIFLTLWITFFLLAGGNYSARCKEAAGYVGFFCGSSAIYAAIAMLRRWLMLSMLLRAEDNAERGVTMATFTPIPRPAGVRGNPGPFGLLCFGMTTCMLMFVTTTWSSAGFIPVVMSYAMFFGGAGQLIAGILELIKGNTFAGTAFSSYGCFWMGWFLFNYFAVSKITPSVLAVALTGDTLWCGLWGVLTFLFYIVTLRKNGCLQTIFLTLWITFFLLAGGNYSARCKEAAGYVGFFCGSSAIYAAIAMLRRWLMLSMLLRAEDNAERGVTMAAFTPIPRPAGVRGNPGPFGLLCFGMTTCMLMFVTTTWSSAGFIPVVMSYAMFFGGAGQLIAGILELIKGNTFAGTAFSSYGCFWMGWFLFNYFAVSKITPSVLAVALTGDTLWCGLWGVLTFLFYIVTLRKNGCLQTIFLTLWITFFLLAGGNYSARCKEAAGYVGFFCGSSAIYTAIAMLRRWLMLSMLLRAEDNAERGVTMAAFTPIPRPAGVRGNPGPFGLLCFGMTTCMLMFVTTTWSSAGFIPVVMSYAMFFGGAGQLIAGILELIKGNTFAGTAFSSYGCFWMGWFLFNYFAVSKITPSVLAVALTGDTLWCGLWGVLTFLFYIVTLRKNGCLQTIFLTLWITFFLLAGGNYSARCKEAAGYVGFFCGSSAIYAAIAMLYQDELGWTLPGMRPTNFI
ncbi:hypothetical protein QJQ45_026956 [Haematococcus lacustris]|nr:hypothetical protein QJQ45_026956 [Haematococcus lacustris]